MDDVFTEVSKSARSSNSDFHDLFFKLFNKANDRRKTAISHYLDNPPKSITEKGLNGLKSEMDTWLKLDQAVEMLKGCSELWTVIHNTDGPFSKICAKEASGVMLDILNTTIHLYEKTSSDFVDELSDQAKKLYKHPFISDNKDSSFFTPYKIPLTDTYFTYETKSFAGAGWHKSGFNLNIGEKAFLELKGIREQFHDLVKGMVEEDSDKDTGEDNVVYKWGDIVEGLLEG